MNRLGEWLRRLWYLLNRGRFERELQREMDAHRAMMRNPRRFGNTLRLREQARDVWGWTWLDDAVRDVRFAWRTLRRAPGFAIVAILSLALATGATTAIFSIVNGVLLRPLPFQDPERLVQVYGRNWRDDRGGSPDPLTGPVAAPELHAFATGSTSFEGFAAYQVTTAHLNDRTGTERLTAVVADLTFFSVLGVEAIAGRTFWANDPPDSVVISGRLWQQRFGGNRSLPGGTITLNGRAFTVIGIMPEAFQFPYRAASLLPGALPESRTDVWIPLEPLRSASGAFRRGRTSVVGRLKRGVHPDGAAAELRVIAARLEDEHRATGLRAGVRLERLADAVVGSVAQSLWMLFVAVGLVLTAACANVASLLLARMAVRTREVVTRAAIGAGRNRLVRQFLTESLLLSVAGALGGAAIAEWGSGFLVTLGSTKIPRAHEIALDWPAFTFLFLVCLVTAVIFGVAPALVAARIDVNIAANRSSSALSVGRRYGRMRDGLVVLEVALAFVLALGAAALVREVHRLENVDPGIVTDNVITLHLTPNAPARDYYAIEDRVGRLPGVEAAGFTQLVPLQNWGWSGDFAIRGPAPEGRPTAGLRYVTPGYFRALGIPLVKGRLLTEFDTTDSPRVILVNDALAQQYFPGADPTGRELDRGTIVGVVGSVRQTGLDRPVEPEIYYPAAQNIAMASDIGMSLIVRTAGPPEPHVAAIRAAVHDVNPRLAIFNVKSMQQVVADSLWELNVYRGLIGLFATLVLLLAAIGLYGVISYNVASRTREFAVRLALGSEPAGLTRVVMVRAAGLASAGLAAGIVAAMGLTLATRQLDVPFVAGPATYATVSAVLAAIALVASVVPALGVLRVNPATALRHE